MKKWKRNEAAESREKRGVNEEWSLWSRAYSGV